MTTSSPASYELYDLVLDRNWEGVINHCKINPQDAAYADPDAFGETPLYLAMSLNPPCGAVSALIEANRNAIYPQTKNKDCPLHVACRFGTSYEVMYRLLCADPATARMSSKYGKNCLFALDDFLSASWSGDFVLPGDLSALGKDLWAKVCLILTTAYYGKILYSDVNDYLRNFKSLRLFHCCVGVPCPYSFQQMIFKSHRQQVEELHDGSLPLSIASALPIIEEARSDFVIEHLLEYYPIAAKRVDSHGKFPLHLAINAQKTWTGGVKRLVHAAPEIVRVPDVQTKLYPFMTAYCVQTSFLILRFEPDVMRDLVE